MKGDKMRPLVVSDPKLIVDGSDLQVRRLLHALLSFAPRLQKMYGQIAALLGLTETQFMILMSLRHLGDNGRPNVSELTQYLHLNGAFVTTQVATLNAKGLIEKKNDTNDRRVVLLSLTPAAHQLINRSIPRIAELNDMMLASISRDLLNKLIPVLEATIQNADRASKRAAFFLQSDEVQREKVSQIRDKRTSRS